MRSIGRLTTGKTEIFLREAILVVPLLMLSKLVKRARSSIKTSS